MRERLALAALFVWVAYLLGAEVKPRLVGDVLRANVPSTFHFVTGKPLENLKDGSTVAYDVQLSLLNDQRVIEARSVERFVFSYDLWEERFSVAQLTGRSSRSPRTTVTNLTAEAAEQWCVDRVGLSFAGLDRGRSYRLRIEVRADGPRRRERIEPANEPPVSLATLIDLFSRPATDRQRAWASESSPFRLDNLK